MHLAVSLNDLEINLLKFWIPTCRREARRRQLGVSNQAEPEDAMSDYFDKRWEGKDT